MYFCKILAKKERMTIFRKITKLGQNGRFRQIIEKAIKIKRIEIFDSFLFYFESFDNHFTTTL